MNRFNIGDKVRAVNGTCILNVGQVYTVTDAGDGLVWVNTGPDGELDYSENWFEAAPAEETPVSINSDTEVAALAMVIAQLNTIDADAQRRVVSYLADRFDVMI